MQKTVGMLAVLVALVVLTGNSMAVGTGSLDRVSGWYPAGTNLTVTATAEAGDELKGWTGGTNSTESVITFLVDGPKSFTATFIDILHTITASVVGNGTIDPAGPVDVAEGEDITFTITPAANHYIADVFVDAGSIGATNSYTFSNVVIAHTIEAQFAINTYEVSFEAGAHGTITSGDALQTIDHGADATPPTITAASGYTFTNWDGVYTNVTSDLTLTALYTTNDYTLTFDSAGGSTVADITQPYGSTINPPDAPTRTGHTFAGWDPVLPGTMPAFDETHTAQWTTNDYSFIVISEHGTPNPVGTNYYEYGTSVAFAMAGSPDTIPSNTMYEVTGWVRTGSEPATGATTNGSFAITNDTTMTWQWSTNYWVEFTIIGE